MAPIMNAELLIGIKTIEGLQMWDFLKTYEPPEERGFMFDSNPIVKTLMNNINLDYPGHSGASLAETMRQLQYIAKYEPQIVNYYRRRDFLLFAQNLYGKTILKDDMIKEIGRFI
jgi:hypothetical protein